MEQDAPHGVTARAQGNDALFTMLYDELRRMARRELWRHGALDMFSTTTLVHEVWLGLNARPGLVFDESEKFLAYATHTMRGLIIDRLRKQRAQKRGGEFDFTSLDGCDAAQAEQPERQRISEALDELETVEPVLARVVDLKFFHGFTLGEVARLQGVAERTVQRQWQRARQLLYQAMTQD